LYRIDGNRVIGVKEDIRVAKLIDGLAGKKMTFVTAFWTDVPGKKQLREVRFAELNDELKGYGMEEPLVERFAGKQQDDADKIMEKIVNGVDKVSS